jgi:stage III sporulation protein AE
MSRLWLVLAGALFLGALLPAAARAEPPGSRDLARQVEGAIESYLDEIDWDSWSGYLADTDLRAGDAGQSVRELLAGDVAGALRALVESGAMLVPASLRRTLTLTLQLLVIVIFSAILQHISGAMGTWQISGGASLVLYLCIVSLIGWSFLSIYTICGDAVGRMLGFFDFLLPVLMTLLAATGGLASAAGLQPTLIIMSRVLAAVVERAILPTILGAAVLVMLNHLALEKNLTSLINFLKSLCKWAMGTVMTALTAIVSIQGVSLAGYDGISIRTAKYTVDTIVPVVGGMFSDLVELMTAGSVMVKNAVGTLGLITLLALIAQPLITLLSYMLAVRLSAALAGPLGAERIGRCLEDYAGLVLLWILAMLMVAAFLFLMIFMVVAMGNAIVMYR